MPDETEEMWALFRDRAKDVREYVEFVSTIVDKRAGSLYSEQSGQTFPISTELRRSLTAAACLLLYNMVEASIRNAISALHKTLSDRTDVTFDDLTDSLKALLIKKFKKRTYSKCDIGTSIGRRLLSSDYHDEEERFSGNVDGLLIRKLCEEYGFDNCFDGLHKDERGECLLPIKERRNALAHGRQSFSELGTDLSVDEIKDHAERTTAFLEMVLRRVDDFIRNERYRSSPL